MWTEFLIAVALLVGALGVSLSVWALSLHHNHHHGEANVVAMVPKDQVDSVRAGSILTNRVVKKGEHIMSYTPKGAVDIHTVQEDIAPTKSTSTPQVSDLHTVSHLGQRIPHLPHINIDSILPPIHQQFLIYGLTTDGKLILHPNTSSTTTGSMTLRPYIVDNVMKTHVEMTLLFRTIDTTTMKFVLNSTTDGQVTSIYDANETALKLQVKGFPYPLHAAASFQMGRQVNGTITWATDLGAIKLVTAQDDTLQQGYWAIQSNGTTVNLTQAAAQASGAGTFAIRITVN